MSDYFPDSYLERMIGNTRISYRDEGDQLFMHSRTCMTALNLGQALQTGDTLKEKMSFIVLYSKEQIQNTIQEFVDLVGFSYSEQMIIDSIKEDNYAFYDKIESKGGFESLEENDAVVATFFYKTFIDHLNGTIEYFKKETETPPLDFVVGSVPPIRSYVDYDDDERKFDVYVDKDDIV